MKTAYRNYNGRGKKLWLIALCLLLAVGILGFSILEGIVFAGAKTHISGDPKLMVVFGCKVEQWGPSVLLQDRLDTAAAYLLEHQEVTVVVSGGQGDDEPTTEAKAMADYLVEQGIAPDRILQENRSRNTWQNVTYTIQLLETNAEVPAGAGVLLVSSGFHLTRIQMLWNRGDGVGPISTLAAPVSHRPAAVQMFFREPFALVKSFLFDR